MNLDLDFDQVLKQLRTASKQKENQGKPPLLSPDVAQTKDFIFTPINNPLNRIGDSGPLLLAKRKSDNQEQYLIKHAYTDCACNEFVYTKLAQGMGYKMPDAILFQLSDNQKEDYFITEYIIGLRYLDLEIESPTYAQIREKATNWTAYFSFKALYHIFDESDSFEIPLAKDGFIYRIDTTDAFPINTWHLSDASINLTLNGYNPYETRKTQLLSSDFSNILSTSMCDMSLANCLKENKDSLPYFLEPFIRIQDVSSAYIDQFLNTLCYFYPDFIGDYFKCYITALQKQCAEYVKLHQPY